MAKQKFSFGQPVSPNEKAPLYAKTRAKSYTATIVDQLGDGYYTIKWSDGEKFKVQGSHYDAIIVDNSASMSTPAPAAPTEDLFAGIKKEVKDFIIHNDSEIEKIQNAIQPQVATIAERRVINTIAREINRIPSPKVYKLMQELISIQPELGNLSVKDLYLKAENVLELSIS